ncbi:type-4 ice-structuring protein-like [Nelusetta ayraudi]|uniref:type-4 ice-structuring protein-like n=1 Tax=Nelusetta ayraudi TaxID=303726 RepID=UPI003F711BD6
MKLTLFVAAVVLALAHGSLAQEATDFSKVSDYFQQLRDRVTEEFSTLMNNPALQEHAETIRAQVEPLTSQISAKMETDIKPMVSQLQQQMAELLQRLKDQTAALN